jgi:hypothetical protein
MAIAFIVMMEAAKSAQEDLKAIMAQVKAINREKGQLRELMNEASEARPSRRAALDFDGVLQLLLTLYEKQIEAEARELLNRLDSMSEMGETESLRLQMMMDRMSKMMNIISNLLAKLSETNSQIVQNLK